MVLDVIIVLFIGIAIFRGIKNGLVQAVFSILAFILGIAAALKLSNAVTTHFPGEPKTWWPFLAFLVVFLLTALIVSLIGRVIQRTTEWAMMGWINRLGGIFFYLILYGIILSVFLFYLGEMGWISEKTRTQSYFYPILEPFAPKVMALIGKIIPVFSHLFEGLQDFFGDQEHKISA